jgi:hypothetical protein
MPWLLSPTNAIDDLKIGLYESSMYVIAGVTEHVGSVAAKELLAKKKPVKVIVRDAKKGETWSKQGACYVMFPESAGFTKTQRTSN